jgi:acyl-CoA thioesterase FadM
MNLWLRLLHLITSAFWRPRLDPMSEVSRLPFRVLPTDLDFSMHFNNGRYWTLMDLGQADLMIRSGLWRTIFKNRWLPVVSAGKIRFRRELRLFQPFTLETRIVAWTDTSIILEHRMVSHSREGANILSAIALVRVGLYDRKERAFVTVSQIIAALGREVIDSPTWTAEVAAFIAAEEALKAVA